MSKKAANTHEISAEAFPSWLRAVIGTRSIEEFATSIGFKRQRISAVINGREAPGELLVAALKKHGLVGARVVYTVRNPQI
jgi:hypothetical protein